MYTAYSLKAVILCCIQELFIKYVLLFLPANKSCNVVFLFTIIVIQIIIEHKNFYKRVITSVRGFHLFLVQSGSRWKEKDVMARKYKIWYSIWFFLM